MAVSRIRILCDQAPAVWCQAVAEAIAAQSTAAVTLDQAGPPSDLTVRLEMLALQDNRASARLIWTRPGGAETVGPAVTISAIDAALPARAPTDLARSLLRQSDLPL